MKDVAVVPVKSLSDAKKRLSPHLGPDERKRLVVAMLSDVMEALSRSDVFHEIFVVSPDATVAKIVEPYHSTFLLQNGSGLNTAVQQATIAVLGRGAVSLVTVLADMPLVQPSDFEEICHISKARPRVVMAPSMRGGTNVMAKMPPDAIANSYGRWSYAKHLRIAQLKGIPVYSVSNSRLAFDIDTIDDVRDLRQRDSAGRTHAGRLVREFTPAYPLARSNKQ